jgi:hypothetical protein
MYPSGLIYKYAGNPTVYILNNGTANPITDWTVYLNNVAPIRPILTIPDNITFPVGPVVTLRSGTLVKSSNDTTVYLTVAGSKRAFISENEFLSNGYTFNQVYTIADINLIASMPTITTPFERPIGSWIKYDGNPTVYFINSARLKRAFTTWTMFKLFVDNPIHIIPVQSSETYADGPIVIFPDGILVKGSAAAVYLTAGGQLRPFGSYALFQAMGFKDKDVVKVEDSDLQLEPIGAPVQ